MTDGIRQVMQDWTGYPVDTCPWRAFHDPFVHRVIDAIGFNENGNMAFAIPDPTNRLVEGIRWYMTVDNRVQGRMHDLRMKEMKAKGGGRG